jgi:hypothetical protein
VRIGENRIVSSMNIFSLEGFKNKTDKDPPLHPSYLSGILIRQQ